AQHVRGVVGLPELRGAVVAALARALPREEAGVVQVLESGRLDRDARDLHHLGARPEIERLGLGPGQEKGMGLDDPVAGRLDAEPVHAGARRLELEGATLAGGGARALL